MNLCLGFARPGRFDLFAIVALGMLVSCVEMDAWSRKVGILSKRNGMGPKTIELCEKIREVISLLRSVDEHHWAGWLDRSLSLIERADFSGVESLLRAFGGMGSFSDLTLTAANGHSVEDSEEFEVNDRLHTLRTRLYELADEIRRTAEISD